ncbi:porin [Vibrio atlanticus]|nr:porin [Vibrio atlanticus]
MKKTIIALAILASGSASAAINVYDKDGVKVDVSGAVEVQAIQTRFAATAPKDKKKPINLYNDDVKIRLDDGDLQFDVSSVINDDLTVIGSTGFKYEKSQVENDLLTVGVKNDTYGTFTIGRQATLVDDSGISNDIEMGLGFLDSDNNKQSVFLVTDGDEVAKYKLTNDTYWFGASYGQKSAEEKKEKLKAIDLGAGVIFGDAAFNAYYQDVDAKTKNLELTHNAYQLEATYKLDALTFGASYSDADIKAVDSKKLTGDLELIKLTAAYTIENITYAIGTDRGVLSADGQDLKIYNYYANVKNKVNDNVSVYGEVGYLNSDKLEKALKSDNANLELGYVAGLEVKF